MTGETSGDRAGYSVSSAGDVNGDGFADVIVGAFGADAHGAGTGGGAAYVVFGTDAGFAQTVPLSSLDGNNGFRLNGGSGISDSAGISVSSAGDFNGDGIDDLIVGCDA